MAADLSLLVLEDNALVREEMLCFLSRAGWRVDGVDCGEALNAWLLRETPDIVILDVNLPHEDGYSIATCLRESHPRLGIIMLTARVRPSDRATGYNAGADVYLTKPTQTRELIDVIENLARRLRPRHDTQLRLDRSRNLLLGPRGDSCRLSPSESRLLELLALAPERTADTDFLLVALTDEVRSLSRNNLSVLVSRLRSKAHQLQDVAQLVAAHRGHGYRLLQGIQLIEA